MINAGKPSINKEFNILSAFSFFLYAPTCTRYRGSFISSSGITCVAFVFVFALLPVTDDILDDDTLTDAIFWVLFAFSVEEMSDAGAADSSVLSVWTLSASLELLFNVASDT